MKNWIEPELWSLKATETESDNVTAYCFEERALLTTDGKNQHWCHALNAGAGGWHDNGCGHPRSNHHQTPDNPDHNWDGVAQTSKCCCGGSIGY